MVGQRKEVEVTAFRVTGESAGILRKGGAPAPDRRVEGIEGVGVKVAPVYIVQTKTETGPKIALNRRVPAVGVSAGVPSLFLSTADTESLAAHAAAAVPIDLMNVRRAGFLGSE